MLVKGLLLGAIVTNVMFVWGCHFSSADLTHHVQNTTGSAPPAASGLLFLARLSVDSFRRVSTNRFTAGAVFTRQLSGAAVWRCCLIL